MVIVMKNNDTKLNERQERFCECYVANGGRGIRAVWDAGYNPKNDANASSTAVLNLRKEPIKVRIRELMEIRREARGFRDEITEERVKEEIGKLAFIDYSDLIEFFDGRSLKFRCLEEVPEKIRPAIKSIKITKDGVEVHVWDKLAALEMLAKNFNMYSAHQAAGADKVPAFSAERAEMARKLLDK